MNNFNCYIYFPSAGSGWIVDAVFDKLCNSSTADGEGTPELYNSDLGISYFLLFPMV